MIKFICIKMKFQPGLTFLIILFFIFFSCKKDDVFTIEPASVFIKSSKEKTGVVRVFAGNGEIKDQSILNRFNGSDSFSLKYMSDYLFPNPNRLDTIRFVDSKNARIFEDYSYTDFSVIQQKSDFVLSGKQPIHYSLYGDLFTRSPGYLISQYKPPVYAEYLVSSTGGNYIFGYDSRKEYVLTSENGILKAPWILMIAHYKAGYTLHYSVSNTPDFNFYKSLNTGDTVVLQQYSINYKKY